MTFFRKRIRLENGMVAGQTYSDNKPDCYDAIVALTEFVREHSYAPAVDHHVWREAWAARLTAEEDKTA